MASFDYVKPVTPAELLDGFRQAGAEGAILAGGTDLLVKMRAGTRQARVLFDIGGLDEYRQIVDEGNRLRIGASALLADVAASAAVLRRAPSLVAAIRAMSSRQIRNRATLGGNIVTASPAADGVPPLLAAEAALLLNGPDGQRKITLAQFIVGPGKTALYPGETLQEIRIPAAPCGSRDSFVKVGTRRAQAISVINLAGRLTLTDDGRIGDARIVLGAVAPTALRARRAEAALLGQRVSPQVFAAAARLAAEESTPIADTRGTADGRRLLVEAWTRRLLQDIGDGARRTT